MGKYVKSISQEWLRDKHIEDFNCNCDQPKGTETLRPPASDPDICGDIEICLNCFGAIGCVY